MTKKKTINEDTFGVSSYGSSDFGILSVTTGSVNVAGVSGTTDIGKSADYTAYVNTLVTEASASINAVLASVSASAGNSLSITTTLPVIITASSVSNAIPIELLGTITNETSGYTASGTLSLVTAASAYLPYSLSMDVSAGGYTLTDSSGIGTLTAAGLPVSGTILTDGSWTIDFTNQELLTVGTEISGSYEVSYYYTETATPIVVRHTVSANAVENGTASAVLSAIVTDPVDVTALTSSTFTLSTDYTPDDNPWAGRGALPGETALETRGRFIDEGII